MTGNIATKEILQQSSKLGHKKIKCQSLLSIVPSAAISMPTISSCTQTIIFKKYFHVRKLGITQNFFKKIKINKKTEAHRC